MTATVRCPTCNSEAGEIDRGLFDGVGFDAGFMVASGSLAPSWLNGKNGPAGGGSTRSCLLKREHRMPRP
jgi:hypothetical protein